MPYTAPKAAKPTKSIFDPFNSSATGHQRADNSLSGSTSWRDSRSLKLREQFNSGRGGGKRVSDTVGAGSLDYGQDGRTESGGWLPGAKGLRKEGQSSIWESMKIEKDVERPAKRVKTEEKVAPTCVVNPYTPFRKEDGSYRQSSWTSHEATPSKYEASPSALLSPLDAVTDSSEKPAVKAEQSEAEAEADNTPASQKEEPCPQIFAGLNIYINGSTMPTISDHKLKHLLSKYGANMSISLGRRTVTHVILGTPSTRGNGRGGGLAGTKIQTEVARKGGESLKYVNVEWVTQSIEAGKRLPESRFEGMRLAPKGVPNVASMFKRQSSGDSEGKKPG